MENIVKFVKDNDFLNTSLYIFMGALILYAGIWIGRFLNQGIHLLFK